MFPVDAIFNLSEADIGKEEDDGRREIPIELQRLFAMMLLLDEIDVNTSKLTDSFGWSDNEVCD